MLRENARVKCRHSSLRAAMIVAGRDSVVPARRSEPLRGATRNLVFDCIIPDAEHNDLYERPEFWGALVSAVVEVVRTETNSAALVRQSRPPGLQLSAVSTPPASKQGP